MQALLNSKNWRKCRKWQRIRSGNETWLPCQLEHALRRVSRSLIKPSPVRSLPALRVGPAGRSRRSQPRGVAGEACPAMCRAVSNSPAEQSQQGHLPQ